MRMVPRATCIALIPFLVVLGFSSPVSADEGTARLRAAALFTATVIFKGFSEVGRQDADKLSQGQFMRYPVTLYGGERYALFAAGDDSISDLDIHLYDEDGDLVAKDDSLDNVPIVIVTPRWTGRYYLDVVNYRGDRGWFCMAIAD